MNGSSEVSVDRHLLLQFFDEAPPSSRKHATAVVSVAGEELGLALLVHYLKSRGSDARLVSTVCTTGSQKGPRLDGWVQADGVLYQVEVKNWSAHAIGGKRLAIDASEAVACQYRVARWHDVWREGGFRDDRVGKVLTRMKPPQDDATVEPLVAFWVAMHPEGDPSPFFSSPVRAADFARVNVFSMSSYLRKCSEDTLRLDMPATVARMRWLDAMLHLH